GGSGLDVSVFDIATGDETLTVPADVGAPRSLSYSTDGALLAAGRLDGCIVLFSADGREKTAFRAAPRAINAVAFASGGRSLAAADVDGTVSVWDLASGRQTARFPGRNRAMDCLEFAPDGKTLVASSSAIPCPVQCHLE